MRNDKTHLVETAFLAHWNPLLRRRNGDKHDDQKVDRPESGQTEKQSLPQANFPPEHCDQRPDQRDH